MTAIAAKQEGVVVSMPDWRTSRVKDSNLSARAKNALLDNHCIKAGDVAKLSVGEIYRMPNIGKKTGVEIIFWLISLFLYEEFREAWRG